MFYGLAKETNDYLKDHISAFVALAPCTKLTNSKLAYINMSQTAFDRFMQDVTSLNIRSMYGPTWNQDLHNLCLSEAAPICLVLQDVCIGNGQAVSIRTIEHAF